MKILLLGATGRTGKLVIEEALKRGHKISAVARDPEKLKDYPIEITKGSPYDYETVEKAISGCQAVTEMKNASINRFVALSTIGAGSSWKSAPAILRFIVSLSNLKFAFQDHGRQEEILKNSSVGYTICRAPMLSSDINSNGAASVKENENPPKATLSRNSAAEFFIRIIENVEHIGETVNLSNNSG